jgi:hypothetical protein
LRGQQAEFLDDSTVVVKGQSVPGGNITSINNWKNAARVIFACKSVDLEGKEVTIPHYISAPRVKGDTSVLTPVTSFSVLIVSNTKTKTMIDVTKGVTGRFEFTPGQTNCEVSYDTFTSGSVKDQWKAVKDAVKLN